MPLKKKCDFRAQIATPQPFELEIDGQTIEVATNLLNVINGKVDQVLTDTKIQLHYISNHIKPLKSSPGKIIT